MVARMTVPTCPVCDNLLDYEEVDIGVGIQTGNYRCDCCGWYPERNDEDIWSFEHENLVCEEIA